MQVGVSDSFDRLARRRILRGRRAVHHSPTKVLSDPSFPHAYRTYYNVRENAALLACSHPSPPSSLLSNPLGFSNAQFKADATDTLFTLSSPLLSSIPSFPRSVMFDAS